MLNPSQSEFVDRCLEQIANGDKLTAKLLGRGGVGKTFTVVYLLQKLIGLGLPAGEVLCLFPTHKLATAWRINLRAAGLNITVSTVHSSLGFYPDRTDFGNSYLTRRPGATGLSDYKLVVLEEAYLYPAIIVEQLVEADCSTIWLGDAGQLSPIADGFSMVDRLSHWSLQSELKINERQKDPALEALVNQIRKEGRLHVPDKALCINRNQCIRQFLAHQPAEYTPGSVAFLGFTNRCVNSFSHSIREELYSERSGFSMKLPMQHESIRVKRIVANGMTVALADTVLEVVDVFPGSGEVICRDEYDNVIMSRVDIQGKLAKDLASAKIANNKKTWKSYYKKLDTYLRWRLPQASTVHSFQGETVDHVYLAWEDLKNCRDPNMIYTAASRARLSLTFVTGVSA